MNLANRSSKRNRPCSYDGAMIARHWHGWTKRHNADAYETLLSTKVLPGLKDIQGYCGGHVLRNDGPEESEFVVINFFDTLDAVRKFAGPNYSVPVFEPEAKLLLTRFDGAATHYAVRLSVTNPCDRER